MTSREGPEQGLLDARGVEIDPGDTVIYGFGVGRSIAMAEGVVLGEEGQHHKVEVSDDCTCKQDYAETEAWGRHYRWCKGRPTCSCGANWPCTRPPSVSLTPSGRVRLRVVRRSYSSGEKPVVDVAPDRLVVLKGVTALDGARVAHLPPSPLPTNAEKARQRIEKSMARSVEALRATEAPEWWVNPNRAVALAEYHAFHAAKLKDDRRKLKALEEE